MAEEIVISMKKPKDIIDYEINKKFTDRDEARKLFWKWYEKSKNNLDDFFVLSYYGIGGIGKSKLVDQLCHELEEKSCFHVKYDFEYTKDLDPYNILLGIKRTIRNQYGDLFHFPLFNAALIILAKKSDVVFENDEVIKSVVAESPHLQLAVNAISLIPIVGGYIQNFIEVTSQLYADIDNLDTNAAAKKRYKHLIDEMPWLEADELRSKMPMYFWNDMTENLKSFLKPLVIFLDTYENYIDTYKTASNVILDSWLRESSRSLIQRIPGILWIISGQDKITWGDNGEWDEYHLGCFEVKDFIPQDSEQYLKKAGITDTSLITHICKLTQGVPIYLDLCVDTYYLLVDKGIEPTIQNFEVDQRKIANRFVKYLDSANRDLVNMLAAMGSWSDNEAEYVGYKLPSITFSKERYISILRHSFFKRDANGKNKMHEIVANALVSELLSSTLDNVNAILFHYRVNIFETETISFSDIISRINDATDAFCRITSENAYPEQYSDFHRLICKVFEANEKGNYKQSLELSSRINHYCANHFANTKYYAESLMLQGECFSCIGEYKKALQNSRLSYSIRLQILGKDHADTLYSLHNIGVCHCNLGQYEDALDILNKVYEARKHVLGDKHPDTLESLHSIGVCFSNQCKDDDGLDVFKQVYKTRKHVLGDDHPDTLESLSGIGMSYSNLKQYEEALDIHEQVYDARKRVLGDDHPITLESLCSIGIAYRELKQYEEALDIHKQVYNAQKRVLGDDHPKTLESLFFIGVYGFDLRQHQKALDVLKEVYDAQKRVLGDDHPYTQQTLQTIITLKRILENPDI